MYLFHPAAVFYGGAPDFHDRHRDMRLDVNNMSYEVIERNVSNVFTLGRQS